MPLYEYRCADCAQVFETVRATSERDEAAACPGCGATTRAERLWSAVAMRVVAGRVKPRTGAEQLAGGPVKGLGARAGHRGTSVLQAGGCGGGGGGAAGRSHRHLH